MRLQRTFAALLCVPILGVVWAAAPPPRRKTTMQQYRRKILNPESAGRAVASAGINTARNVPHEWGSGGLGFVKRAGSSFGQHIVSGTIEFGVAAAHHENLQFQRSNLQGTWPRLKFAVKSTFIVPRTDRRGHTLAVSRIAGNMGGGLVSRAWQPASTASLGAGLASGGIGLGADVGVHVAREFWPQKKKVALRGGRGR